MTDKLEKGLAGVMQGGSEDNVIGGINSPIASGNGSAIIAGDNGLASGEASAGIGGKDNEASGVSSVTVGGTNNEANGAQSVCIGGTSTLLQGDNSVCVGGGQNQMTLQGDNMTYIKGPTIVYVFEQLDILISRTISATELLGGYIILTAGITCPIDTATNVALALGLTSASFTNANTRFSIKIMFGINTGGGGTGTVTHSVASGWITTNVGTGNFIQGAAIATLILTSTTTGNIIWVKN